MGLMSEFKVEYSSENYSGQNAPRMVLRQTGHEAKGIVFLAEILNGELYCFWPSSIQSTHFKEVAADCLPCEDITWRDQGSALWARVKDGDFTLDLMPDIGRMPLVTRILELTGNPDIETVLNTSLVAARTISLPHPPIHAQDLCREIMTFVEERGASGT